MPTDVVRETLTPCSAISTFRASGRSHVGQHAPPTRRQYLSVVLRLLQHFIRLRPAFFGISGVLYLVSLLLTALVMGYESRVTSITQLARPATVALVPTLLMLGTMSWLRFWLEGQGLIL